MIFLSSFHCSVCRDARDSKQGIHKGAAAPLVGGAGAWRVPALFAGLATCSGVGGTRPPRLAPEGGNGKGGDPNSLLPQAISAPRPACLPDAQADLFDRFPCRLLAIERRLDPLSP